MPVRLALLELSVLAQPLDDALVGLVLRQPGQLARLVVHPAVGADHRQLRQAVVAADLVVRRVVAGRDLQRARCELALDSLVGDHRHVPPDPRHDHLAADQVAVPLVLGMHGDRDVGEDGRRPHRRDRDVPLAVDEGIADVGESVVGLDVRDLEVGQRREVERAPVDDPVRAVDPALVVEVHEEPHHRAHVRLVHGEALAPVVERGSDPPELVHDLAAVLAEPFPDARLEGLAAEVLPGLSLEREVLLDRVLRRDAGVVVARLEEDVVALHPPRTHDRVRQRELQRVSKVEVARHVGRRMRDREALPRRIGIGVVEAFLLPGALPALLDAVRLVERIHQQAFRESESRGR